MGRVRKFIDEIDQCFAVYSEKKAGKGEDSFLYSLREDRGIVMVFDGCGGSGAKLYPPLGNRTGAYLASRVLTESAYQWFDNMAEGQGTPGAYHQNLKMRLDKSLAEIQEQGKTSSLLLGSMSKEFPSTLAGAMVEKKEGQMVASFLWSGDSRGYLLDRDGLHQVTVDDVPNPDAMVNLREDGAMTNVVTASRPYDIHEALFRLPSQGIVLAATDGCFGYLRTPMEFEKLLLGTLMKSGSIEQWRMEIDGALKNIAGDDYTMCVMIYGYGSFVRLKKSYAARCRFMEKAYVLNDSITEEALFEQWEQYKKTYEAYR